MQNKKVATVTCVWQKLKRQVRSGTVVNKERGWGERLSIQKQTK
jgi:hypothetical protein